MSRARAFSLVELLIAVAIFGVVSIAIYSTFSSGIGVLRKVKRVDLARQRFLLREERFHRELRQMPVLRKQLFLGAKERVSFAGIVDDMPSRITYYFDHSLSALMRNSDAYSEILTKEGAIDPELKSKPVVFLNKIKKAEFSYLYLDLKKNEYTWAEEWKEKDLPLAVKIKIATETQNYETIVFLPTA